MIVWVCGCVGVGACRVRFNLALKNSLRDSDMPSVKEWLIGENGTAGTSEANVAELNLLTLRLCGLTEVPPSNQCPLPCHGLLCHAIGP